MVFTASDPAHAQDLSIYDAKSSVISTCLEAFMQNKSTLNNQNKDTAQILQIREIRS